MSKQRHKIAAAVWSVSALLFVVVVIFALR